ncbi:MAG: D-alanine--D-alanine ligase [Zoogloeaceae bacterium]|jgi:D-alanine-D-alanine ligase|nr:D-alanine--D-alanine ligase [Zoogloeaceae bacterium]
MKNPDKVAVLLGGTSAEREVSLKSGAGVLAALRRQGVDAHPFDPAEESLENLRRYDRVFIALHGRHGEDGTIQGMLELMGIPYTGPGVMTCAVGMDKLRSKLLWRAAGLPVPDYVLLEEATDFAAVEARLGLPLFVKPVREGSSVGVTMVKKAGELPAAYAAARKHDALVMAEAGILGGEYTVALLGDAALPMVKIEPNTAFYDYDAKYLRDDTRYLCPCDLAPEKEKEIQEAAKKAFRILGGKGWSRIDVLLDTTGAHHFLEINTSPGMTSHSLVPMAAKAAGISYEELVLKVLYQESSGTV